MLDEEQASIYNTTAYCAAVLNLAALVPIIGLSFIKFRLSQFFQTPWLVTDWSPFMQPLSIAQPLLNFTLMPHQALGGGLTPSVLPQVLLLALGHLILCGFIAGLSWHMASILKAAWWRLLGALLSVHVALGALGIILNRVLHLAA